MSSRFLQLSFRRITDRRTEFRRLGHFLSGVLDFFPSGVDSSMDIGRENIQKLIDLRGFYR